MEGAVAEEVLNVNLVLLHVVEREALGVGGRYEDHELIIQEECHRLMPLKMDA